MNWKWILIHSAIIYFITGIFGFIVGVTVGALGVDMSLQDPIIAWLAGFLNLIAIFLSVTVIAAVQRSTWRHFFYVWVLLSVASLPNLLFGFNLSQILEACLIMIIIIAAGKLFGLAITKVIDIIFKKNIS